MSQRGNGAKRVRGSKGTGATTQGSEEKRDGWGGAGLLTEVDWLLGWHEKGGMKSDSVWEELFSQAEKK